MIITATRTDDPKQRLAVILTAIAARAATHDQQDVFVAKNFAALKSARLMSLPVPTELGGDGLSLRELASTLQQIASECASTGLAFSMHSQAVAGLAWHWRHHKAPVATILRRIARDQLAVATTNGSDWLAGSGSAIRTKDGFRVDATKRMISAANAGDLLATNAIYDDPMAGRTVLHFITPMKQPEIKIERTWHAMGMRGTGSETVRVTALTISDRSIVIRRPCGVWHPLYHAAVMTATPLIFSVYLGIAQRARDLAVAAVKSRPNPAAIVAHVGMMEAHLNTARIAVDDMLQAAEEFPGEAVTNRVEMARTLAGRSAIATVEIALELTGGAAYMRGSVIELLFRDVQAARFHPVTETKQREMAGRIALGLGIDVE
jgi:alkylation response protein AidB-like acyl-CoA dehydrogenase